MAKRSNKDTCKDVEKSIKNIEKRCVLEQVDVSIRNPEFDEILEEECVKLSVNSNHVFHVIFGRKKRI